MIESNEDNLFKGFSSELIFYKFLREEEFKFGKRRKKDKFK